MYNIIIQKFYTLLFVHPTNSSKNLSSCKLATIVLTIFSFTFTPIFIPFPFWELSLWSLFLSVCTFVFCVCLFYIPHLSQTTWYLSFSA